MSRQINGVDYEIIKKYSLTKYVSRDNQENELRK